MHQNMYEDCHNSYLFNQNLETILTSIKNRIVKLVVVYLYKEMPWDIENEQPLTMNVTNSRNKDIVKQLTSN